MSAHAKLHITVLLDHELRAVARALRVLSHVDKSDDNALGGAVQAVITTCHTALWHVVEDEQEEHAITVATVPPVRVTLIRHDKEKEGGAR